jgi:hypothetical protein
MFFDQDLVYVELVRKVGCIPTTLCQINEHFVPFYLADLLFFVQVFETVQVLETTIRHIRLKYY